jgi:hypothetical protein
MKKIVNGIEIEMTAAEIAAKQAEEQNATAAKEAEEAAKTEKENLKASAKAKLIAGEPLTEEEADTIVL